MTNTTAAGPVIFGEVLFDSFPNGNKVLGGAPFNVAWHLQAFGAAPLLVSRVGSDEAGAAVRRRMHDWHMSADGLQRDREHPTGAVTVTYEDGEPRFEILADQAYDFVDAQALPERPAPPPLLYHGSLAVRAAPSAAALARLKEDGAPVFLDINLRPPWWDPDHARALVADARWVKLNEDELTMLDGTAGDLSARARAFRHRFDLGMLVVTLGARGALAVTASDYVEVRPTSSIRPVDPVGAGDAFASVIILGLLHQWPLDETLRRAQAFASGMVERQGATVNDRAFYQPFLNQWSIQ